MYYFFEKNIECQDFQMEHRSALSQLVGIILLGFSVSSAFAQDYQLHNSSVKLAVNPAELKFEINVYGTTETLSAAQQKSAGVKVSSSEERTLVWNDSERNIDFHVILNDDSFEITAKPEKPTKLIFPIVEPVNSKSALSLPIGMGHYVPVDDTEWAGFLEKHSPYSFTEGFSMPFIGVTDNHAGMTWIWNNPFYSEAAFSSSNGHLKTEVVTSFTTAGLELPFSIKGVWGSKDPVDCAVRYREHLKSRSELVTLSDKIKKTTATESLIGAGHVYIWGASLLNTEDVKNWKKLALDIKTARTDSNHIANKFVSTLDKESSATLNEFLAEEWASQYSKRELIGLMNRVLEKDYTADQYAVPNVQKGQELKNEIGKIFPDCFKSAGEWGGILSEKSIEKIHSAGIDKLWMGLPSWREGMTNPAGVTAAIRTGYLIGPYDSYHSMHLPNQTNSWETAQFGKELYDTGEIIDANGKPHTGFKKVGKLLSPVAAEPYVRTRLESILKQEHFNTWFFDCDAFGQYFDNYSKRYNHNKKLDLDYRIKRLKYAADTFGLVIGSEGGISLLNSVMSYAHGLMTPGIEWGDEQMYKDKASEYYLGRYYPENQPEVFFKEVPLKPELVKYYFAPQFRIPLYPVALGDSVIATHQWGFPSQKFKNVKALVRLTELLYGVPPLDHLSSGNLDTWLKDHSEYHKVFSPLQRAILSHTPMTNFAWLDETRLIQETKFGNIVTVTANFSDKPWKDIAEKSVQIHYLQDGKTVNYKIPQGW